MELSCVVISSACDAAPYLLVDGVELLLQHQSQRLCVRLAAGGEEGGANIVLHV